MFLVDTNVINEARKGERANRGVRAFFAEASERDWPLFLSVISNRPGGRARSAAHSTRYTGFDPVKAAAPAASDFEALENLRHRALAEQVPAPKPLELVLAELAAD